MPCRHTSMICFLIVGDVALSQDISKELNKCREEGAKRLDLSKSQVQNHYGNISNKYQV